MARRNLGGVAAANGIAYFAGGCGKQPPRGNQGIDTQFYCDTPSAALDAFRVDPKSGTLEPVPPAARPPPLSLARGWVAAGATARHAVFAGGGTSMQEPHSRRAEVIDLATNNASVDPNALSVGRWGIAVASSAGAVYFAGGLEVPPSNRGGYRNASETAVIDKFSATSSSDLGFSVAPFALSVARESATGAMIGNKTLMIAGGWDKVNGQYASSAVVDVFRAPRSLSIAFKLKSAGFDCGLAALPDPNNGTRACKKKKLL